MVGQCTIRSLEEYRRTEEEERAEEEEEEEGDRWRRKRKITLWTNTNIISVIKFPLFVFLNQGETPTLTSGEVFVDIDDQEPLVPDQVKPTC